MKLRLAGLLTAAVVAFVLVGCRPPPAPGWVPPVVTATVSPDPVVAGEPFTVEVTAVDTITVTSVGVLIRPPTHLWEGAAVCVPGDFAPAPTVTRLFECNIPAHAPNGSWFITASAMNERSTTPDYAGGWSSTITVVGGEDDQMPPALDSVEVSPSPVVIGEPFSVTIRAFDEHHLPPSPTMLSPQFHIPAPPAGQLSSFGCAATTPTVVDATLLEWRFTGCSIPVGSSPFDYGAGFWLTDTLGYDGHIFVMIQAVAG